MWCRSQKSKKFLSVNYMPLSVIMMLGIPNRWMMSMKKRTTCSEQMFVMGRASTHLENLSMAANGCIHPLPFGEDV